MIYWERFFQIFVLGNKDMKTICFTGGGSSGHVTPNLAIIQELQKENINVFYIGSYAGIEKELVTKENIKYYPISSGKLRRYFSWQNFIDPYKITIGIIQAFFKLRKLKPAVVFSKGGFVSFPVALAAKFNKIPVVAHESDMVSGLANKLVFPLAEKICVTFDATKNNIGAKAKVCVTGSPIRSGFFLGDKQKALQQFQLDPNKKTILVTGGGLGSAIINQVIIESLPELLKNFNVIHLTGKGKINSGITEKNYIQREYMHEELFDVMALADLVISRAGSNTLYELILLKKKHILIPLSKKASRGDQIDNAKFFEEKKLSYVIQEEVLNSQDLIKMINTVFISAPEYEQRLSEFNCPNGTESITAILKSYL